LDLRLSLPELRLHGLRLSILALKELRLRLRLHVLNLRLGLELHVLTMGLHVLDLILGLALRLHVLDLKLGLGLHVLNLRLRMNLGLHHLGLRLGLRLGVNRDVLRIFGAHLFGREEGRRIRARGLDLVQKNLTTTENKQCRMHDSHNNYAHSNLINNP
jgi:hypothetical protein